jgi:hypothetical protein
MKSKITIKINYSTLRDLHTEIRDRERERERERELTDRKIHNIDSQLNS